MKKVFITAIIMVVICLTFAACDCQHQYEEKITTEPSCTAAGIKTFTCKKCSESYTEEIPMIEHTYTSAVTKEPTCAEKGITTFTCTVCSNSYTEELDLVAHTLGEATITKEPTCVEEGEKTATCTVCGATEVVEKIATVEHTYQTKVKVAATCTEKGVNTLTCSVCNDSKDESANALGHNYQQSSVITKVTCTSNGEVTMTCSRCNNSYNETKKATGHNWVEASCTTAKYCTNCNQKEGEALGHKYANGICTQCGKKSYSITVDPLPAIRSFEHSSTNHTYSQVSINTCTYSVDASGNLTVTIGYTKTYSDGKNDSAYPTAAFRVVLLNSDRSIYSFLTGCATVFEKYVYVDQYKTTTVTFKGIEPGEYIIAFSDHTI